MAKLPVTELKDLATALALTANAVDAVLSDGKVDVRDLGKVRLLLAAVKAYTAVDLKQVIPQASDIDAVEADELAQHFKMVFNLADDAKEAMVERGLEMVLQGVDTIRALLSVLETVKGAAA